MDLGQDADAFKVTRYTRRARTHPRDTPSSDSRKGKGRGSRTNFISTKGWAPFIGTKIFLQTRGEQGIVFRV
jgi:hypothetical protein